MVIEASDHPKLEALARIVTEFREATSQTDGSGKFIVFTEFRDSADVIRAFLNTLDTVVCGLLIGQGKDVNGREMR
jgi:ERCC4-related helicase